MKPLLLSVITAAKICFFAIRFRHARKGSLLTAFHKLVETLEQAEDIWPDLVRPSAEDLSNALISKLTPEHQNTVRELRVMSPMFRRFCIEEQQGLTAIKMLRLLNRLWTIADRGPQK